MRECYFQTNSGDSTNGGGMTHSAEKILKEAHMMRLLQHPKIIKMEDVFSAGTTLFMVMEMVHGKYCDVLFYECGWYN
jgi:serine/threonine protein kinase